MTDEEYLDIEYRYKKARDIRLSISKLEKDIMELEKVKDDGFRSYVDSITVTFDSVDVASLIANRKLQIDSLKRELSGEVSMIKIENVEVVGWEAAIRGMRNSWDSWDKSDTIFIPGEFCNEVREFKLAEICNGIAPIIGENDLSLMKKLSKSGTDHRKFMRMITVYADITAPMYWWKEADTYKVGTVRNSCSTMHCITNKEFTIDDFSTDHLFSENLQDYGVFDKILEVLNNYRRLYLEEINTGMKKEYWWQIIQLLPSSYNQRSTFMLNYEVLSNIYKSRRNHKLTEWQTFCEWIENDLPYSELITGKDIVVGGENDKVGDGSNENDD
jgi:hypothetical protein